MTDQQPWPVAPPPPEPYGYVSTEVLPELEVRGPEQQRRSTVLFRLLLVIPQIIVLFFLEFAAFFVLIVGWFAALFTGRLPAGIASFLTKVLAYETRVEAYGMLLVDEYPPFAFSGAPGYPVQIDVRPTTLNRAAVLFRIILLIPAAIVQSVLNTGWYVFGFFTWLITLILGRMPDALFGATAATLRYAVRFHAYTSMLTPAYPKRLFGDGPLPAGERTAGTRPLRLSTGAQALLIVFLILGAIGQIVSNIVQSNQMKSTNSSIGNPTSVTQPR